MNVSVTGGRCLRVAYGFFPSLSYVNPARGPVIDILKVVAEKLNLCYELVPSVDGLWGAKLPNGSWFGMLGMLERKEVDLSVGPFAPTPERATVADFSVPILISDHTIIYPRPQVQPDLFGFVKPFAMVVWMAVLISLLTVTVSSRLPTLCRRDRKGENVGENRNFILWAFMVLLGQALPSQLELRRERVVKGLWMLTAVIIGSVYKSNLKAMLIVPKVEVPFDSLEEMVEQDEIPWMLTRGSITHSTFEAAYKEDPNSVMGKVWGKMAILSSDPNEYFRLAKKSHGASIIRFPATYFLDLDFSQTGNCHMAVMRKGYLPTFFSIAFLKNSTLIPSMDKVITQLKAAGIVNKFLRDETRNATQCLQHPGSETPSDLRPLALGDFYGIFCLYVIGVLGSVGMFIGELVTHHVTIAAAFSKY